MKRYHNGGIYSGHPDYLPTTEQRTCAAREPDTGFVCTRDVDHDGDHAAHGDSDNMLCTWERV